MVVVVVRRQLEEDETGTRQARVISPPDLSSDTWHLYSTIVQILPELKSLSQSCTNLGKRNVRVCLRACDRAYIRFAGCNNEDSFHVPAATTTNRRDFAA